MPIHYRCPACDQLLSISSRKAGSEVPCPQCGATTIVPRSEQSESVPHLARTADPSALSAPIISQLVEAPFGEVGPAVTPETLPPVSQRKVPVVQSATAGGPETPAADSSIGGDLEEDAGGFPLRRSHQELGELDLTSMVDVTFLLLIFFMVTASFSLQKTIEVPSPKPDDKGAAQSLTIEDLQSNTVFVKIDERNGIFVDDVPAGDPSKLSDVLTQARLTTLRNEVAIDAHPEALHETVVQVIDAATAAGMQKIRIVSRTAAGE